MSGAGVAIEELQTGLARLKQKVESKDVELPEYKYQLTLKQKCALC